MKTIQNLNITRNYISNESLEFEKLNKNFLIRKFSKFKNFSKNL